MLALSQKDFGSMYVYEKESKRKRKKGGLFICIRSK